MIFDRQLRYDARFVADEPSAMTVPPFSMKLLICGIVRSAVTRP